MTHGRAHWWRASAGAAAALALLAAGYFYIAEPWLYERPITYTSVSVIDGDTIRATNPEGKTERVRLLGINAPEHDQCGGADATAYLTQLLAGHTSIQLVRDDSQPEHDRYGRTLAYVDLADGTDLGLAIIEAGYATELTIGKTHDRASSYRAADATARETKAGAWTNCAAWGR